MPEVSGPGDDDPFDPTDLPDVRDRVVMPVVSSIVRPEEFESVDVGWGPRTYEDTARQAELETEFGIAEKYGHHDDSKDLYVLVAAAGATYEAAIWQPKFSEPDDTLGRIAFSFADRLEDWVFDCVTRWKELRIARVVIPERGKRASSCENQ